jgi:hypothetical protein
MSLIEINWRPSRTGLRAFGLAGALAFGAIGAWVYFRASFLGIGISPRAAEAAAWALAAISLLFCLLSWVRPGALRPAYVAMVLVGLPIGLVLSYGILAVVFYGVLTPTGIVLRLLGRDALGRGFQGGAKSYWAPRRPVEDVGRYFRQF